MTISTREFAAPPPEPLFRATRRVGSRQWALLDRSHLAVCDAPLLRRELERLARPGIDLVIDVAQVRFMDGSAIAALVYVRGKLGSRGTVRLVNVQESIEERLRELDVYELFANGSPVAVPPVESLGRAAPGAPR